MGTLTTRDATFEVRDFAEASRAYSIERDKTGEGYRTFPEGRLTLDGKPYRVSYNGKVWSDKDWQAGDEPVYSPYES